MKNSIIYLGIAMLSFANAHSESINNLDTNQEMYFPIENVINVSEEKTIIKTNTSIETEKNIEDYVVNPGDLVYIEKPIYEVVNAYNQIIESNLDLTLKPLNFPFSDETDIIEGNKIIESDFSNIVYPLDFDIINKNQISIMPIEKKVLWID